MCGGNIDGCCCCPGTVKLNGLDLVLVVDARTFEFRECARGGTGGLLSSVVYPRGAEAMEDMYEAS